jgi:hypothetical protein
MTVRPGALRMAVDVPDPGWLSMNRLGLLIRFARSNQEIGAALVIVAIFLMVGRTGA